MQNIRDKTIRFRVNDSEYALINEKAHGSVSDWLRSLALEQKPKRKAKPINPELTYQLNKIGVNLNQIAKHLNQNSESRLDKMQMLLAFIAIEDQLKLLREKYDS